MSPYVEQVMQFFSQDFNVQIQSVDYEFQKGGDKMLKINR
jgi:hypothetical protein